MSGRETAASVLRWILSPMSPPWDNTESSRARYASEVVAVGALPGIYRLTTEYLLNLTVPDYDVLLFLGEIALPLGVALLAALVFRALDYRQATMTALWIQRALALQLLLLGAWAGILIASGLDPEDAGLAGRYAFAYWFSVAAVLTLAGQAMRKAQTSERLLALLLYALVASGLFLIDVPRVNDPWYLIELNDEDFAT